MASNLTARVSFAAVAIPVAVGLVWLGGWPLAVLVSMVSVLGVRELFDLASKRGLAPLGVFGLLVAFVAPLVAYAAITQPQVTLDVMKWLPYASAAIPVFLLVLAVGSHSIDRQPLASVAVTLFGVAYAGILPIFLLQIRHSHWSERSWAGVALVFFPLVVTWVCDTAAMFGGKAIGGTKLAPMVSPGKTRAGAMAGVVGGVLMAPLFALVIFPAVGIDLALLPAVLVALLLSTLGQVGDLAESLLKREAGVKDSSSLIPGHGGVLDRFDSLYFVLPAAALCFRVLGLV